MTSKYVVRNGKNGLQVYGNNLDFLRCKDAECINSGPADTGKTFSLCLKVHLCACKYPGVSIAMIRKTQTSCYNTIVRTFTKGILGPNQSDWPCVPYGGINKPERFNYKNESVVFVAGLDKPSKLLSSEFDLVAAGQVEEFNLGDWEIIGTRATGRAGNMPYAQVIGDCNPGSPTHWIRSRAKSGLLTLFSSTHRDNPELFDQETGKIKESGKQRIDRLRRLSGSRYQRLFQGLWSVPEGAIYDIFDEVRHKVAAFDPPKLWPRFVGVDPFGAYIGALWIAYDPHNQVLNVYREYYQPFGITTTGHAQNVAELSKGETVFAWVGGGPSERQARTDWQAAGVPLMEPPFSEVWAQIDRVYNLLKTNSLVIHDSCPALLSEIGEYRRKMKNGVPTEQIENKDAMHLLDSLRYIIAWLSQPQEQEDIGEIVYNPVQIY